MKYVLTMCLIFLITINADDLKDGLKAFDNKDYKEAKPLLLNSCNNGNDKGCSYLGFLYLNLANVKGYQKDISMAKKLFTKACDNKEGIGCRGLATLYKDDRKVKYWETACNLGDMSSCKSAAINYDYGFNIKRDRKKALEFYTKMNSESVKERCEILKKRINTTLNLFGVVLKDSSKGKIRYAISEQKGKLVELKRSRWLDKYDSSRFLRGSSSLEMSYLGDKSFVKASFKFPGSMNTELIEDVRKMVVNVYGESDDREGNRGVGKAHYVWIFDDSTRILVSRGWPDTTTYLTFYHPERLKQMNEEIKRYGKKIKHNNPLNAY